MPSPWPEPVARQRADTPGRNWSQPSNSPVHNPYEIIIVFTDRFFYALGVLVIRLFPLGEAMLAVSFALLAVNLHLSYRQDSGIYPVNKVKRPTFPLK